MFLYFCCVSFNLIKHKLHKSMLQGLLKCFSVGVCVLVCVRAGVRARVWTIIIMPFAKKIAETMLFQKHSNQAVCAHM